MSSSPREHKRRKVDTSSSRLRSLSSAVSPPAHETTEPETFGDASSSRLRSLSAVSPLAYETTEPVTFGDAADPLKDLFRGAREDSSAPEKVKDLTAEQKVIDLTADVTDAKDINGGKSQSESKLNTEMQKLTSPFRLTKIRDLPASENRDTVGIDDILGDVMLREVWLFNYMHEIPWVMEKLDEDIKQHVKVWFVHGNWKQDDASRKFMEATAKDYPNVKLIAAYMPEAFGTHHTKIMVLFRADDTAQVIIHTANMIRFDWTNMTQAAWISPLLPLAKDSDTPSPVGDTFKSDLLEYFAFYGKTRTGPLVDELKRYSFSSVKAVFIGSVPGRHKVSEAKWGWPKLRKELRKIPTTTEKTPKIFAQCSSIATLGANNTWLTPVFFKALSASKTKTSKKPNFGIIFPTAQEIRDSLNGYASGSSIHLRTASQQQQKQLTYIKPLLYHWSSPPDTEAARAGRDLAAPHIKTYIRFAEDPKGADTSIDWALLTSANLSTQAWGAAEKDGMVRICSYEAGVLVYPELFGNDVRMKPSFLKDTREEEKVVPLRMPYGLPVAKYGPRDEVWVAGNSYEELDWLGRSYGN